MQSDGKLNRSNLLERLYNEIIHHGVKNKRIFTKIELKFNSFIISYKDGKKRMEKKGWALGGVGLAAAAPFIFSGALAKTPGSFDVALNNTDDELSQVKSGDRVNPLKDPDAPRNLLSVEIPAGAEKDADVTTAIVAAEEYALSLSTEVGRKINEEGCDVFLGLDISESEQDKRGDECDTYVFPLEDAVTAFKNAAIEARRVELVQIDNALDQDISELAKEGRILDELNISKKANTAQARQRRLEEEAKVESQDAIIEALSRRLENISSN